MEVWKAIEGTDGMYEVSNTGKIRSLNYKNSGKTKELKPAPDPKGYMKTMLLLNGRYKTVKVHRLVAIAFVPNPENKPQVNHKDECKLNNHFSNLEWCTAQYNVNYSGTIQKAINACKRKVLQFEKTGKFIKEFESATNASKETKTCQSAITLACQGKYKTAGGYIWKYYEEN